MDAVVGEATLPSILALLGLLLAFSFGKALGLSHDRKTALVEEVAALGTVFLRADCLSEPGRTEIQTSIFEYAQTRMRPRDEERISEEDVQAFFDRTLQAQVKLWPLTLKVTRDPTPAPMKTFFAGVMNDALDAHLFGRYPNPCCWRSP